MCGGGAVVKTTGAYPQVMGSIPTRKVFLSFLVVSHALPHTSRSPLLAREPPVPSPPSITVIHTYTHTHAHAHLRSHTSKLHTSDLSLSTPRYH